ncbi:hypothetical protein [Halobellus captivus]|uniref:hypothetical protein n=1 Tax=Halobellus captivus TaxID=2592614 RepID=UPI0011A80982|nr:hypothetical protein [Halobellus captivus]
MTAAALELLPLVLELSAFGLGVLGLSLIGAYVERFAIVTVQHGQPLLGLWAAVMGFVALYFAYSLTVDRVVPALSELTDRQTTTE